MQLPGATQLAEPPPGPPDTQHTCGAMHVVIPHATGPTLPPSTAGPPLDDPLLLPLEEPLLPPLPLPLDEVVPLDDPLLLLLVPPSPPGPLELLSVVPPHAAASATPSDTANKTFTLFIEASSAHAPSARKGTLRPPGRARLTRVPPAAASGAISSAAERIGLR